MTARLVRVDATIDPLLLGKRLGRSQIDNPRCERRYLQTLGTESLGARSRPRREAQWFNRSRIQDRSAEGFDCLTKPLPDNPARTLKM